MSAKDTSIGKTINEMRELLNQITQDLEKSHNGNKAASQRVRTGTVKLEKVAKAYRKESIQHEKKTKGHKKAPKASAKKAAHKPAHKAAAHKPAHKAAAHKPAHKAAAHKPAHKAAAHKPAHKAAAHKPAAKAKSHKVVAKPHAFALKRPTAKLPARKHSR